MRKKKSFSFDLTPEPKDRPRMVRSKSFFGKQTVYTPKNTKITEQAIQTLLRYQYREPPIDEPCGMALGFYLVRPKSSRRRHPSVRPDIDNYAKLVLDACNGILYRDDALICDLNLTLRYASHPRIDLSIWLLD